MLTFAPGMAAPEGSLTVPAIPPKTACPKLSAGHIARISTRTNAGNDRFIELLPDFLGLEPESGARTLLPPTRSRYRRTPSMYLLGKLIWLRRRHSARKSATLSTNFTVKSGLSPPRFVGVVGASLPPQCRRAVGDQRRSAIVKMKEAQTSATSRREFLQGMATVGIAANIRALHDSHVPDAKTLPNIVYIHSHDSGRYLQPYGHAVPTPNLQRLASQGVLFRQAFSVAPTCSPSRASLLTGQCAHRNGMLGLAHRGFAMNDYQKHIIHTLRRAGYKSVLAGLQHIAAKPETIGFDEMLPPTAFAPEKQSAAAVAPAAAAFIESSPHTPFFLDVGFQETHREYPMPTRLDYSNYILPTVPT